MGPIRLRQVALETTSIHQANVHWSWDFEASTSCAVIGLR